jgi:hypothetical protein
MSKPQVAVPFYLKPFGLGIGYSVKTFATTQEAADFVLQYRGTNVEMPCWRRFLVVDGALIVAK